MTTQPVSVVLTANVAQYVSGMHQATTATQGLATAGAAASASHTQNWDKIAKGATIAGGVMVGAAALGAKAYADFDQAMSYVRANAEGSPAEFAKLGASVRSVGKDFGFSAVGSANGAEELAKAGLSLSEIMGGALQGSLTLAAAGGVSVAEASETAATAMSMFKLEGKDVGHIADVLAAGANASTASVGSLSQALRQGGGVAASFGISLEDTVAALAMFDQNGLKGSDAGTSLKTMLTALANPSKKAAQAMEDLGIKTFDASGKFIGMAGLQDVLKAKMAGLTEEQRAQAMATIFGSDAMRAANVLFGDTKGMNKWRADTDKAGFAAKNAGTRMDNLKGDLTKLKAAFMDVMIGTGASGGGFLRPVTQGATTALNAVNAIPEPVKTAGFALTAASGAALLLGAGLIKVVTTGRDVVTAMVTAKAATAGYVATARAAATANGAFALTNIGMHGALTSTNAAVAASATNMGRLSAVIAAIGLKFPIIAAAQASFYAGAAGATRFQRSAGLARIATDGWAAASARASAANWSLAASAKAVGLAAAAVAVAAVADPVADWGQAATIGDTNAKKLSESLKGLADNGQLSGEALKVFGKGWGPFARDTVSASDALEKFSANANEAFAKGFWDNLGAKLDGGGQMGKLKKMVEELDGSLTYLVKNGKAAEAKKQFDALMSGVNPDKRAQVAKMFTGYNDAVAKAGKAAAVAKSPTRQMADAISGVSKESDQARQDVDALTKAIKGMGDTFLDEQNGALGYQDALSEVADALRKNRSNSDITTEGGRDNKKKLQDLATSTRDWASAVYAQTGSMQQADAVLKAGKVQVENYGKAMGFTKPQIDALTNAVLSLEENGNPKIDPQFPNFPTIYTQLSETGELVYKIKGTNISIPVSTPGSETAIQALASVKGARQNADGSVTISASANTASTMTKLANVKGARVSANGDVTINTTALNTPDTIAKLQAIANLVKDRAQYITTYYQTKQLGPGTAITPKSGSIILPGAMPRATGGPIYGPGTGTSDSIPAMLSNGEHVLTASDVAKAGGQGAVYRMRAAIQAGALRFAGGGAVGYADGGAVTWSPDLSGIFALIQNLTWDNEKTAYDKLYDLRAAIVKSKRDVEAARKKLAEDQSRRGVKASTILADQNKVNDLLQKQLTTQRQLTAAQSEYNRIKSARGLSAAGQFTSAAGQRATVSKKFVADLTTIEKRGFPLLARSLAEQGDDDAVRVAASMAASPLGTLRNAQKALTDSSAAKASLDALLSRTTPGAGAASLQAQREGNARALALQAANAQFANQAAVVVRPIVDTASIVDGLAKQIRVQVQPGQTNVTIPGIGTLATATTEWQATQSGYGTTEPGVSR